MVKIIVYPITNTLSLLAYLVIMIIRFAKMPIIINSNHTSIDFLQYLDMTKPLSVLCCSIVRQDIRLLLDFIQSCITPSSKMLWLFFFVFCLYKLYL